jgi:hypothetical protein
MDRRLRGALTGNGLDWTLAGAAVAIGIVLYLLGDRTNWNGGFGYDGLFWGELAKNFGSAVFAHGPVVQGGFEPAPGPPLEGVDSYYIFRIVPSGLVWIGLNATGLSPTHGHVIGLFYGLNAFMYGLAVWCWCRGASLLGFGDREKWLGAIALIITFGVMRTGGYYPVATDPTALGLGSLAFYLWLRGWTIPLAATLFLTCFTWPLAFLIGGLMLLLPAPTDIRGIFSVQNDRVPEVALPSRFGIICGLVVAIPGVIWLTARQLSDHVNIEGVDGLPLFPLSLAITGVFIVAVIAYFLPETPAKLWGYVRLIRPRNLALAVLVVGGARLIGGMLSTREGFGSREILEEEFWWTTLGPGLFLVVFVSYLGPLMLGLFMDLPRVARDSWRLGPGAAAVIAIGIFGALSTQPRTITNVLPFLLVPAVLVMRRHLGLSTPVLVGFFLVSVAFSRIWLYIGPLETNFPSLLRFPAQAYYMAVGPWTPPSSYAMQLAGVLLTVALALGVWRRRARGLSERPQRSSSTA